MDHRGTGSSKIPHNGKRVIAEKDFFKTGGVVVLSEVVITLCFEARGLGSNSDTGHCVSIVVWLAFKKN